LGRGRGKVIHGGEGVESFRIGVASQGIKQILGAGKASRFPSRGAKMNYGTWYCANHESRKPTPAKQRSVEESG